MPKTKKFEKLLKSTKEHYVGKKVPLKYRERYGMIYDKEEARQIAFAIAKSKNWRV